MGLPVPARRTTAARGQAGQVRDAAGSSPTGWTSRPASGDYLGDPTVPLWITEGTKKADCGAQYGLCVVALLGVCGLAGHQRHGRQDRLADWNDIALNNGRW